MAGQNVSGFSAPELKQSFERQARASSARKLYVRVGSKQASLPSGDLGIELDPAASAQRALGIGRSARSWANVASYLRSFWARRELPAVVQVDAALLEEGLAMLEASLIDDPPFMGSVVVNQGQVTGVGPRSGRKIARRAARAELERAVASGQTATVIALPIETLTPALAPGSLERCVALARRVVAGSVTLASGERRLVIAPGELGQLLVTQPRGAELELGIDTLRLDAWLGSRRSELEAPARDARFEISPRDEVKVIPSEPGLRVVAEDVARTLWQAAQSEARAGELPLRREPLPARSTAQAEQLGIKQLVGSFTTRHPCCQPRVENIHRIATLLDGLVVEPGQTVSVNAIVGPRTQKNGFVLAPGIEDGEMVDTVGGGVSQFATTFFNAVFHAGYDIIERQPHTYWFPRYPMGHEATLSWPHPDIVFKNDSSAGLLVKTSFSKTTITVKLYGDTGGRKVTSSVSERREIVKPAVELLPNREIEPDEEKVKDGGMIGWSVIAARTVTFADGTKKDEKRKVTYKPKVRRVEVHPCRIPDGEPGATGEACPEPVDAEEPATEEAQSD